MAKKKEQKGFFQTLDYIITKANRFRDDISLSTPIGEIGLLSEYTDGVIPDFDTVLQYATVSYLSYDEDYYKNYYEYYCDDDYDDAIEEFEQQTVKLSGVPNNKLNDIDYFEKNLVIDDNVYDEIKELISELWSDVEESVNYAIDDMR